MRYEGDIYRPPSEAYSLLIQVTIGCTHNKCTFCNMFKEKQFRVRKVEEVLEDLEMARETYRKVPRIFLCDGDALALNTDKLVPILEKIQTLFPECERVGIYARSGDILRKTPEELALLREKGLGIAYLGAESGSQKVLDAVKKGVTVEEMIQAVDRAEQAGIRTSVTFISGLAGRDGWEDHAIETGNMITRMNASYVSLLTLMVSPVAPLYEDIQSGKFQLLTSEEVLQETALLLRHASPERPCVFRSNHASNYVSLRGNLPQDRDRMVAELERAMADHGLIKPEAFRML